MAALEAALAGVTGRLAADADRAAARERIIDRQHQEIERLRSIERVGQLRPVVTDLCRLRNALLRQAATMPAEMTGPKVADLLASFADEVEEALERCGVAVLPNEPGTAFTPGRQQVAAVVDTDDPSRDGTVASVVQDGYVEIDGDKVVVPARIAVHRLTVANPLAQEAKDGRASQRAPASEERSPAGSRPFDAEAKDGRASQRAPASEERSPAGSRPFDQETKESIDG